MKGKRIAYTAAELAFVAAHAMLPRAEAHARFVAAFGRHDVSLANFTALCKRRGWLTGRTGRFTRGLVPHNKDRPFPAAATHPNCRKNQFRKGQEPHNTKFAGHERVSIDGYVEISVEQPNPYTGYRRRYVLKHRWLWEQANGPVPEGHVLKCMDGNRLNADPSNWIAVPRAMLPRLAGRWNGLNYDRAPPELRPAILAAARLDHKARERRRKRDDR